MVGTMLLRGMLVGLLAALLSFGFLRVAGEPAVEKALAFEAQMDATKLEAARGDARAHGQPAPLVSEAPDLVSRPVQAGLGLATGLTVFSAALGGLFALVFAVAYRRMGSFGPRATAGLLALSGLVAVTVVPALKYPASPPAVGLSETIGIRTGLYVAMIALSLAAMTASWALRGRLRARLGDWNAALAAALAYTVLVAAVALLLPGLDEVPDGFPADVLWQFRLASLGAQAILWATLGVGFGAWVEHAAFGRARPRLRALS